MATYKYGPIEVEDNANGYLDTIKSNVEMEYNTTADMMSLSQDGKALIYFNYDESRAFGKMITSWYLDYELNRCDLIDELKL